jgi:hypothetical protein
VYFFYIDEAGSPEGHHGPLLDGETPIFTLNSLCINAQNWRDLDRDYLRLKRRFFQKEIGSEPAEYFEIKGSELTRPGSRTNKRAHRFIEQVFGLCRKYSLTLFSIVFVKNPLDPTSKKSLYTMALQYLCERFQAFLEEGIGDENGIIIVDSRMHNVDLEVAQSHLSFIFGHKTGRTCDKILEAPMFASSKLTAGLQIIDIMGSCIYANFYQRNCMFVPGALDYSHMGTYWPELSALEFQSQRLYDGHRRSGYRVIDFCSQKPSSDFASD